MARRRHMRRGLLGWLLVATACCMCAAHAAVVHIGIGEYPPFKDQGQPNGGPLTEIVVEAFKARHIDTVVEWVPNNRAIIGVMSGRFDGSFGWAHSPERDEALLFSSKPIYTYRMVFVQRSAEMHNWATLEDLAHLRIGITRGNFYSQAFAQLQADKVLTTEEAVGDSNNLMKLLKNRIDLFPLEASVARHLIAKTLAVDEQPQLLVQDKSFWTVPIYFVISKKASHARELMNEFDAGYDVLLHTRRIEILEKKLHH